MGAIERLGSYISRGVYTVSGPFHPFGGAVDIIVVEQPDGSFKSSPWYVRFGKFQGVLKRRKNMINISVNGAEADFNMYLDHNGEAYFLREVDEAEEESLLYPLFSVDDTIGQSQKVKRPMKSISCKYDAIERIDVNNGKIVGRSGSRRSGILGVVFGRGSMKEDRVMDAEGRSCVERVSSLESAQIAADLLEVKWSTNLGSDMVLRKDGASWLEPGSEATTIGSENMQVDSKEARVTGSVAVEDCVVCEEVISSRVERVLADSNSGGAIGECSVEEARVEFSLSRGLDEVFDRSSSGEDSDQSTLEYKYEVTSEISRKVDEVADGDRDGDLSLRDGPSEITDFYSESPVVLETSNRSKLVSEQACYEESEINGVDPVPSCETSESLIVDINASQHEERGQNDVLVESMHERSDFDPQEHVIARDTVSWREEPVIAFESMTGTVRADSAISSVEVASANSGSLGPHVRKENNDSDNLHLLLEPVVGSHCTTQISTPPSDGSDEEQFYFSDLGKSKFDETRHAEEMKKIKGRTCSALDESGYNTKHFELENSIEESSAVSNPISIRSSHRVSGDLEKKLVESLPEWGFSSHKLNFTDRQPLSHSLDLESTSIMWSFKNGESSLEKSEAENSHQFRQNEIQLVNLDTLNARALQHVFSNPEVELSLCKHLLRIGMGSEAALQAFNSEKLDMDKYASLGPSIVKNDRLVVKIGGFYFPWDAAAPIILGMVSFGSSRMFEPKGMIPIDQGDESSESDLAQATLPSDGSWGLWPFSMKRSRSRKTMQRISSYTENSDNASNESTPETKFAKKMVRARTPTSEQLASLNLKEGMNSVTFMFSSGMLGMQQVDARIYLWKWNTRVVISDVDGTITKSDVLGQFMPLVGIDWSQSGVAHLFSAIKENGYQLMFLSARAISQASLTRHFLFNIKQDGKALPDGPVVISPDGLFPSLFREVIRRAPHEFKIACLEDIRALFPPDYNPFYAGFGNRHTDEISYLKVGIPQGKIFTINPRGEIAVNRRIDTRSYTLLHALVNGMFPPTHTSEQENFNSWNYWKLPPPTIDL